MQNIIQLLAISVAKKKTEADKILLLEMQIDILQAPRLDVVE